MAVVVAGVGLAPAAKANPEAERSVTLGGSVIVKPKYEGSDEYEYIPIPIIVPRFSDTPGEDPSTFKKFR